MWFHNLRAVMAQNNVDEALHAQISTWILARIVSFIHGAECSTSISSAPEAEHLSIQDDMLRWVEMGSSDTKSIISRDAEPDADEPFPKILFPNHSAGMSSFQCPTIWCRFLGQEEFVLKIIANINS